jgi:hypothetical protein
MKQKIVGRSLKESPSMSGSGKQMIVMGFHEFLPPDVPFILRLTLA